MHEKCRQRRHLFNFLLTFFLRNEMYCIFCPDSGIVSFFFIWLRYFPSFQICTCYHMFCLKKIAKSFIFYWILKKNGGRFLCTAAIFFNTNSIYYIFNFLDENVSVFLSDGEFYLVFRCLWFIFYVPRCRHYFISQLRLSFTRSAITGIKS